MARYEKPPTPDTELLRQYIDSNLIGSSAAYGKDGKLQFLEIESMDDDSLAILMADLQQRFPQAF